MKIIGFWHGANMGCIDKIIPVQWEKLKQSGLYDACDRIYLNYVGVKNPDNAGYNIPDEIKNDKKIIYSEVDDRHVFEYSTLKILKDVISLEPEPVKVFYIHSKGAATANHEIQNAAYWWGQYMEEYTINRWRDCVSILDSHDVCGVELRHAPALHFSGNFWWLTSDYIKRLPDINAYWTSYFTDRIMSEMYLGRANPKLHCFKNTGQNLYLYSVTKEMWN